MSDISCNNLASLVFKMGKIFQTEIVPSLQTIAMNKLIQHSYQEVIIKNRKESKTLRRLCSNMKRYVSFDLRQRKLHLSQSKPKSFIDRNNHPSNEHLSTTSRIQITLQHNTDSLTEDIKEWLDYHMSCLAFHRPKIQRIHFFRRFDEFVYHPDGSIHYELTARNMLMCDKFNHVDKFAVACAYNFEEDIQRLWPSVSETIGPEVIPFDMYPLQYYWTCRMANQIENIHPVGNSRELRMIGQRYVNRSWEMKYFWDRMSPSEKQRSLVAIFEIKDTHKMEFCSKYLCSEPDDGLVERIVSQAGSNIMLELVTVHSISKLALAVWSRVKNIFNGRQFIAMYEKIFQKRDTVSDPDYDIDVEERLCIEIWNSASDDLKNYARKYFHNSSSLDRLQHLVN